MPNAAQQVEKSRAPILVTQGDGNSNAQMLHIEGQSGRRRVECNCVPEVRKACKTLGATPGGNLCLKA